MAEVREDALADIGLAYPFLRQLLYELGIRLTNRGVIQQPDDIFWLEKQEIETRDRGIGAQPIQLDSLEENT